MRGKSVSSVYVSISSPDARERVVAALGRALPGCAVVMTPDAHPEAGTETPDCGFAVIDDAFAASIPAGAEPHCMILALLERPELAPAGVSAVIPGAADQRELETWFRAVSAAIAFLPDPRTVVDHGRRYENLVNALPDIVYQLDSDGGITFVNDAVSSLGYEPRELVGRHFSVLMHEEDAKTVDRCRVLVDYHGVNTGECLSPKLFNERRGPERKTENLEIRLKPKPGFKPGSELLGTVISYGEVSSVGTYDRAREASRFVGTVGIVRDITLRRKSEEMLRKLYLAVDQLTTSVFIVDAGFTVEYVNPAFFQATGFAPPDVIGHDIFGFLGFDGSRADSIKAAVRDGFEARDETTVARSSDGSFWASLLIAPVRSPEGAVSHAVAILEDVTKRRAMDSLLRSARDDAERASRAKSVFLSNVSHELKNPINAAINAARLVIEAPEAAERNARKVIEQSNVLLDTIGGILDYVRAETGEIEIRPQGFPLEAFMMRASDPYRAAAAAKGLEFSVRSENVVIETDPEKLGRIVAILLDNAVKFTDSGRVTADAVIELQKGNVPHLVVTVGDTGPGMNVPADGPFEPFTLGGSPFARRQRGVGIGLALAYHLSRALGGELRVASDPGAGSRFSVLIPAKTPVATCPIEPGANGRRMAVLVVDDNDVNLEYMKTLIENQGHAVVTADSGAKALERLEEGPVDCVVADIQMPGMSGLELAARVRTGGGSLYSQDLPLIALTAYDFQDLTGEREAFAAVFRKPVDIERLLAEARKALAAYDEIPADLRHFAADGAELANSIRASGDAALAALETACGNRAGSGIDVRAEAQRLGTLFDRLGAARLGTLARQFAAAFPGSDRALLAIRLERVAGAWNTISTRLGSAPAGKAERS